MPLRISRQPRHGLASCPRSFFFTALLSTPQPSVIRDAIDVALNVGRSGMAGRELVATILSDTLQLRQHAASPTTESRREIAFCVSDGRPKQEFEAWGAWFRLRRFPYPSPFPVRPALYQAHQGRWTVCCWGALLGLSDRLARG